MGAESLGPRPFKTHNLRGHSLPFRCLVTGFVTTAPTLNRYQQGRDIDSTQRELVGERPENWIRQAPSTTCEHCRLVVRSYQWAFRQHEKSKRRQKTRRTARRELSQQ